MRKRSKKKQIHQFNLVEMKAKNLVLSYPNKQHNQRNQSQYKRAMEKSNLKLKISLLFPLWDLISNALRERN